MLHFQVFYALKSKFINTIYDRTIEDNDVADACGIGYWSINNWVKAIGVDK